MKKVTITLIALLLAAAVSVMAQDATAEPTAEATQTINLSSQPSNQAGQQNQQGTITRVRFANLSSDAPVLVVYADGQPANVQLLAYPAISGWVEFAGTPSITLVPRGAAQSQALIGPFILQGNPANWSTIAIVGSQQNGTLNAVAFNENFANIPAGCARVTVFHAIEGAPAVNIVDDQGNTLVSGLGFPGSNNSGGQAISNAIGCGSQTNTQGVNNQPSATAEATSEAVSANVMQTSMGVGTLQCTALSGVMSRS